MTSRIRANAIDGQLVICGQAYRCYDLRGRVTVFAGNRFDCLLPAGAPRDESRSTGGPALRVSFFLLQLREGLVKRGVGGVRINFLVYDVRQASICRSGSASDWLGHQRQITVCDIDWKSFPANAKNSHCR